MMRCSGMLMMLCMGVGDGDVGCGDGDVGALVEVWDIVVDLMRYVGACRIR